ncbi:MAG TPA: hypothetical protein VF742_01655, partial [Terracidiphilus sp.]
GQGALAKDEHGSESCKTGMETRHEEFLRGFSDCEQDTRVRWAYCDPRMAGLAELGTALPRGMAGNRRLVCLKCAHGPLRIGARCDATLM